MKATASTLVPYVTAVLAGAISSIVHAQSGESTDTSSEQINEIVVTGTAIRGIAPPGTPVVTFDNMDVIESGAASLSEFMRLLPQNTGGGSASEEGRALGANFGASAVSLRGFGPQRTLTLLNGHRVAPQGDGTYVDISFIPSSALEKIEVVPVGASSIYGADAVGGVTNYTLRSDYQGLETRLQTGTTADGGGNTMNFSQSAGLSWQGGGGLIAYDFFDQEGILAGERSYTGPGAADTSLTPDIERHSFLTSLQQNLGEQSRVLFDGYFVSSDNVRQSQFPYVADVFGEAIPLEENIETDAYGATLTFQQSFGDSWLAQVLATHSDNELDGYDIDVRTGEPTNVYGNIEFARHNTTSLIETKVDGDVFALPAGQAKLAAGAQVRFESFDRDLGGSSPVSTSKRKVYAAYSELYVPLINDSNRRPGIERLEFSLSGRYERFGDVEETLSTGQNYQRGGDVDSFNPQFALQYSPIENLDLRGNFGTSFTVAPLTTLRQSNSLLALSYLSLNQPPEGAPITLLVSGVDPDLKPETSSYWSIGADWRPEFMDGLELSATYYNIELEDVLGNPSGSLDPSNPLIADFVTLSPSEAQIRETIQGLGLTPEDITVYGAPAYQERGFASIGAIYQSSTTNLARREYEGVDVSADYAATTNLGEIGGHANIVYVTRYRQQSSAAQPIIDRLDTPFQPLDLRARVGGYWSNNNLRMNLFLNYADSYEDNRLAQTKNVSSFTTVDTSLTYEFDSRDNALINGTRIVASIQNLFNKEPPEMKGLSSINDTFTDDLGYDFVNATARGRYMSLSIIKNW